MVPKLNEIGSEISDTAEAVGRAVVGFSGRWGRGSGFVVAPGRVLTNAHNLSDQEMRVNFGDRVETATVLGVDYESDLALLERFCAGSPLPVNFMAFPGAPGAADVAATGVARISHGPFPHMAAMRALRETAAAEYRRIDSGGTPP